MWGYFVETGLLHAASGLNSLLSSEVVRLQEEVGALRQQVQGYEADVEQLVATSELGHANPKQKIQYHLRYDFQAAVFYEFHALVLQSVCLLSIWVCLLLGCAWHDQAAAPAPSNWPLHWTLT